MSLSKIFKLKDYYLHPSHDRVESHI